MLVKWPPISFSINIISSSRNFGPCGTWVLLTQCFTSLIFLFSDSTSLTKVNPSLLIAYLLDSPQAREHTLMTCLIKAARPWRRSAHIYLIMAVSQIDNGYQTTAYTRLSNHRSWSMFYQYKAVCPMTRGHMINTTDDCESFIRGAHSTAQTWHCWLSASKEHKLMPVHVCVYRQGTIALPIHGCLSIGNGKHITA